MTTDATTELETLVDRYGLANLVEMLAIVCEEKADHIRANWQDRITANAWAAASREFDRCAPRIKKLMGAN